MRNVVHGHSGEGCRGSVRGLILKERGKMHRASSSPHYLWPSTEADVPSPGSGHFRDTQIPCVIVYHISDFITMARILIEVAISAEQSNFKSTVTFNNQCVCFPSMCLLVSQVLSVLGWTTGWFGFWHVHFLNK